MIALNVIPFSKFYTNKAISFFAVALGISFIIFFNKFLRAEWIAFSLIEVVGFFFFSYLLSNKWATKTFQAFGSKLLWTSFWIRITWVFFSYFYFLASTGKPFEYETADAYGYHVEGLWLSSLLNFHKYNQYTEYVGRNYADMGYPFYLGILYYFVSDHVLVPRVIKAFLGACTCVFAYKIGRNNFCEAVGRLAGIMTMLVPNMIYYCGLHVKETEMVFLTAGFAYLADKIIRSKTIRFIDVFLLILSITLLFFFRTVLAGCLIGSIAVAAFFSSNRISSYNKRMLFFILLAAGAYVITMTPLIDNIYDHLNEGTNNLSSQMDSYATRRDGNNKLARYGSRSIFLPFMIMAPFPTFVDTLQPNAMMLAGAFFTRNVYAFFVFISIWALYKRKQLRYHLLLLSITFSYIFVLASSGFALSERFHLPLLPFLLILAAHGISQMNAKNKKYYLPYLVFTVAVVIGWNWFKLAGRA